MDTQTQTTQSISDDQELAKVLAGVSQMNDDNLGFEETPVTTPSAKLDSVPDSISEPTTIAEPTVDSEPADVAQTPIVGYTPPSDDATPTPIVGYTSPSDYVAPASTDNGVAPSANDSSLESIKKDALIELRPLVDKLDLAPEEKFDIYLLLLRSTDDKALIAPAHAAAQDIADETKRAQALLDVIKEIDYLSNPAQPAI